MELMAHYEGKKATRQSVDTSTLTIEERLRHRIIDGDQIGIDVDLETAMKSYDPLTIINTILLDGMKVVGELFGSGQMQLPFVLQSAETMKTAVRYLEPFMERTEQTARGTMVLATVKGDVHDIGKNLVDIILTNNGYKVINLGIKVPVETMLEAAEKNRATAIGMSGLLVKSTLVMKENLELMRGRGVEIPVVLGGAALTRRYVEHDLREIYGENVAYAEDAFAGLRYMERLAGGGGLTADEAETATDTAGASSAVDAGRKARERAAERGLVRFRPVLEEELEDLALLIGTDTADLAKSDIDEFIVADLHEQVIGGGQIVTVDGAEKVYELTNIVMLPEQWEAGVGMDLVRAMRRTARNGSPDATVYVTCDPADEELGRFYRTLGFDRVPLDDPRAQVALVKIHFCEDLYGVAPALFISKPSSLLAENDGSSLTVAMHLLDEQSRDADFRVAVEEFEVEKNVRKLRVTSDVDRNVAVPTPPFFGSRVVDNVRLEKVFEYINEVALIRGQWQVKKGKRTAEEYHRELDDVVRPKLEEMKLRAKRERLLEPRVIYGFFPCRAEYNSLVVYRPKGLDEESLIGEWPMPGDGGWNSEELEEWVRFDFPRQSHGRHLCISDFFRPIEQSEFDVVAFQIVTMGERATEYAAELFRSNNYADYLYFHGLSVESAEALAEYWHRSVRIELGIAHQDADDIHRLFAQGYRGSRYSFGYPACPDLEEQTKIFTMLRPERIGVSLSEEFMLEPEQSTSAIVVHHPAAKYFNVKE